LRVAEWIQIVFVSLLVAATCFRSLGRARQARVALLALLAIAAIAIARSSSRWLTPLASSVVRDWVPAALLLIPYWQIGQFFQRPDSGVEQRLVAFDRAFFKLLGVELEITSIGVGLTTYLELAYILAFPLIPLGLAVLYVTGLRGSVDYYWAVVLPPTYACYALTPFVQALPPRMVSGYHTFKIPVTKVGRLNHGILRQASIQAITFPSGHVASSVAVALVLLRLEPWAGLIFLWIALSIAVATVVGGYHYAADVLLASVVTVLAFASTLWVLK
jgi:membrane-associated phospholipid phosphatase